MSKQTNEQLLLLSAAEQSRRLGRVCAAMRAAGIDAALISTNANIYYLTGRVFRGYIYLTADETAAPVYFVRRPNHLTGDDIVFIHKIEEMPQTVDVSALRGAVIGLETGVESYNDVCRMAKVFGEHVTPAYMTAVMQSARSVKTAEEIDKLRLSGVKQTRVYSRIPHLYQEGMRDIELQVEIERTARLEGCLGQFRVSGNDMELFMGNVLVGENADSPSPYDFAMGGRGMDPSLPVGADGTLIKPGESVMVDLNGDFTGYMTDMTRCYALEELPAEAVRAHKLSIDICRAIADKGREGTEARALYELAVSMAREAGLENNFMGHRQHAGFVGHGVGIEINELPVLAPRSRAVLEAGNVIAVEPKFVIPGVGAVGIENTYVVNAGGPMTQLTTAPEDIVYFD